MGAIETARDALFGNPPDPNMQPSREGMLSAITQLQQGLTGIATGIPAYATRAELPAVTSADNGKQARVYADPTSTNNGFWIVSGGAWTVDTAYQGALEAAVQPLVDDAEAAASSAQASADSAASLFETVETVNLYNSAAKRTGWIVNGTTGQIITNSGGACTDYIPVEAGKDYRVSWGSGSKLGGAAFYTSNATNVAISGSAQSSTTNGAVFTAPAGANFMVVNVQSSVIPEPPNIMIHEGATAIPYEPFHEPYPVVTEQAGSRMVEEAAAGVDTTINTTWINLFAYGDFVGGQPVFRSGSPVVDLTQPVLLRRGLAQGIQWRAGNDFARYASGGSVLNKYYFAAFTANSVDAANLVPEPMVQVYKESSGGTLTIPATSGEGYVEIDSQTRLVWETGKIDTDVPNVMVGSSRTPAVPGTLYASEFVLFLADAPIDKGEALRQINLAAKARVEARRWAQSVAGAAATPRSKLVLSGVGGTAYVESNRSGHVIRNSFAPFRSLNLTASPCRFNIIGQSFDGTEFRNGADDIAPDHALGTTIDMNHGYTLGRCTATGHGKAAADEGSIWTNGGNDYVLVKVENANSLLIARRTANSAPPTGTFVHGSGATNTGNITVSAASAIQWYPPHNNYSLQCWVDGALVNENTGTFAYDNDVVFIETADILPRQAIIDWWIANGGASGGLTPAGAAAYRSVVAYRFDRDGQLSFPRGWNYFAGTAVTDLMAVQVQRLGNPLTYRVPGAESFTYDGETLDYGMGVSSGRTLAASGTPSIFFDATKLQATGEYANRVISEWADYALVTGFLPVGDAAYDVRRARVSNQALEIRGNTAKLYFRLVDKGAFTAAAGDSFECIAFRHIVPKAAGRPLVTTVRLSDRKAIVYIDWKDFAGIDQVNIPPDLVGRAVTVLDSRNAALIGGGLATGIVTPNVNAAGNHAYLVLEFAA